MEPSESNTSTIVKLESYISAKEGRKDTQESELFERKQTIDDYMDPSDEESEDDEEE